MHDAELQQRAARERAAYDVELRQQADRERAQRDAQANVMMRERTEGRPTRQVTREQAVLVEATPTGDAGRMAGEIGGRGCIEGSERFRGRGASGQEQVQAQERVGAESGDGGGQQGGAARSVGPRRGVCGIASLELTPDREPRPGGCV